MIFADLLCDVDLCPLTQREASPQNSEREAQNCTRLLYNERMKVTYSEARRSLAELLERAARGERITITRHGKPMADLGPTAVRPRLDLSELKALRRKVSKVPLANGVLLAREQERY